RTSHGYGCSMALYGGRPFATVDLHTGLPGNSPGYRVIHPSAISHHDNGFALWYQQRYISLKGQQKTDLYWNQPYVRYKDR
ncbi:MAG: hypothetical protein AAF404_07180, partial [Pseudomonadota bacterium]